MEIKPATGRYFCLAVCIIVISGCATTRHAIPPELMNGAQVYGMSDIRALSGSPSEPFKQDFVYLLERGKKGGSRFLDFSADQTIYVLALSGGGDKGAYGAGLLCGWSASGTRPVFKVVTGISTGAIIAPIAFLGSDYDDKLREFYAKYSTKDILRAWFPLMRILFNNSVASTKPLEHLIAHYFDADLLKRIAEEYNKGRRLYIGTTNLDAQRLVIWDMGKIASIGDENSLRLFRKIILASASIPFACPPVYLQAESGGEVYNEMHVDGGITRQVFFLYDVLEGLDKAIKEKNYDPSRIRYAIYVIRNGYVDPLYKEVPDKLSAITERAVDTILNNQGIGDIYQLYVFAKSGRGDFNLGYIPATHISKAREPFDPAEMQELFDLGFEEAARGYKWKGVPPGLERAK